MIHKLEVLKYPHNFLKKVASPIEANMINQYLHNVIEMMYKLMDCSQGMGLAATQVGLNIRLFTMQMENKKKITAINPRIIQRYGETYQEEGCLSFPGIFIKIKRSSYIKIAAINEFGRRYILEAKGYEGKCIQHEIDHLNGVNFIDHLSTLKKAIIKNICDQL